MSAKTKIVVLRMREVVYTAIFAALGICLIILLIFMFMKGKNGNNTPTIPQESTESANYIAGIYQTSVVLRNEVISVEVIVDENHINSVRLINTNDTVTTMFPLFEPAMTELAAQIVETQSLEDLTYSEDSKYTSLVLLKAVENALSKAAVLEN